MKKLPLILLCFLSIFSCDNKSSKEEVIKEQVVLGKNEIRVIQQNKDFNTMIDKIIVLNTFSTERHDLLYKMQYEESYKYPDIIKPYDIEILSNDELNKLRDIINGVLEESLEIARLKDEILRLE